MAENSDGSKKRTRERGGKRTLNSLGDLGGAPEIQEMLANATPQPDEVTAESDLTELRDQLTAQAEAEPAAPEEAAAETESVETAAESVIEPVAEPGVDQTGTGAINEPLAEDAPEWERLMSANPGGETTYFGRKAWQAKDGGIYLSRRNSKRPQYYAHGDRISFSAGDRAGETVYWDTNANTFTDDRPEGVSDPGEKQGQEKRLTSRQRKLQQPLKETTRETRQNNLRYTLSGLDLDDENRGKFSQAIDLVQTQGDVERVLAVMKEFPVAKPERAARAPRDTAEPASAESATEPREGMLESAHENLRNRVSALGLPEEASTVLSAQIAAATTSEDIVAVGKAVAKKERAVRKAERRRTTDAAAPAAEAAPEREMIPQNNDALRSRQEELSQRADALLSTHKISQSYRDVLSDTINGARSVQELSHVEENMRTYDAQEPIAPHIEPTPAPRAEPLPEPAPQADTRTERERRIANVAKQIVDNILANPKQDPQRAYEAGKRQLGAEDRNDLHKLLNEEERSRGRRFGFIYDTHLNPLDARRASRRELQLEIERAGGAPEIPPNEPPHEPPEPPDGPRGSDALRPPTPPTPEKNPYAINKREYVGVDIKTVQEILADKTHAQYFGELLHALKPDAHDVLKRYYEEVPTEEDMDLMTYAAHEYSKRNAAWESLTSHLTQADVDVFMRRNNMMQNIVRHVGGARGLDVLKHTLRYTAMRDFDAFEAIAHGTHEVHEFRDSYLGKVANARLDALSKRIGIKREDFEDVVDLSSPQSREESLKDLEQRFHAKAGFGRKTMDWLTDKTGVTLGGSSRNAAYRTLDDAEYALKGRFGITGKKLRGIDRSLSHIGDNLTKVVGAEEIREQIAQETIRNEKRSPGTEAGPASFAEAKESIEKVTVESIEEKIKERVANDPQWKTAGASYQDSVLSGMKSEAKKNLKAGSGFWSWLLVTLFGSKFNTAASKATGRPVHVH